MPAQMDKAEHRDLVVADAQDNHNILASKTWTFGRTERGHCTINEGATWTLYSDGSTHWRCDIRSGDSGDEWEGTFRLTNAGSVVLFDTANYHFDISEEKVTKRWDEFRGANGTFATHFNEAQGITFDCGC